MNQFLAKEQLLKKTVIYLPILFAVVFCVLTTRTYNFWDDETNGYYLTSGTLGELLKKMSHNIHEDPPLYNILQWIWRQVFGESVIALRSLSILFFILTLPIVFVFTRCLSSEESAIYALLFMCFSPFNLIFSPSARWYSLMLLLATISTLAFYKIICDEYKGYKWPIIYVVSSVLSLYTNYFGFVFLGSHLLYAIIFHPRKLYEKRVLAISIILSVLLLYLPWFSVFLRQLGISLSQHGSIFAQLFRNLFELVVGESVLPWNYYVSIPAFILVILCIVYAIIYHKDLRGMRMPLFILIISLVVGHLTRTLEPKRLLMLTAFFYIPIGIVIEHAIRNRPMKLVCISIIALLVYCWSISLYNMVMKKNFASFRWLDPYKETVEYVKGEKKDKDIIITNSNSFFFYYGSDIGFHRPSADDFDEELLPLYPDYELMLDFIQHLKSKNASVWYIQGVLMPSDYGSGVIGRVNSLLDKEFDVAEVGNILKYDDIEIKRKFFPGIHFPEYRIILIHYVPPKLDDRFGK